MPVSFVLLSAGSGTRMKMSVPKQFLMLRGRPLFLHTLERIEKIKLIDQIIVVVPALYLTTVTEMIQNRMLRSKYCVISGGCTRQESVFLGLSVVKNDTVILHEAARPFVTLKEYEELIDCPEPNVTYGSEIPFTVLGHEKGFVSKLYDRATLFNVQLPQKFELVPLREAHEQAIRDNKIFTEDASMLYFYKKKAIRILPGTEYNIKITHASDLQIAEKIYSSYILSEGDF